MRIVAVLSLALSLAACHRSARNDEAVRQGVIDYLSQKGLGLNMKGMDVAITNLSMNGSQADATVSITPKGSSPSQGMSMEYQLEQHGEKWTVTGRKNSSQHGAEAMPPGMENPHGETMPGGENPHGAMPGEPDGGSKMPSPQDLPPVKKQ